MRILTTSDMRKECCTGHSCKRTARHIDIESRQGCLYPVMRDKADLSLRGLAKKIGISSPFLSDKIIGALHYKRMRIGELAKSVDVNVETVRYYQRIGLLELPQKPYGGTRYYSAEDLKRLRFIRRAQQIGFSLEDIRALLELSSSDCEQVGKLAAQQLKLVRAKLRQLRRIESVLAKTVEQCARRKGNQPCPIIETLSQS